MRFLVSAGALHLRAAIAYTESFHGDVEQLVRLGFAVCPLRSADGNLREDRDSGCRLGLRDCRGYSADKGRIFVGWISALGNRQNRFVGLVGRPPMDHLRGLRMALAQQMLQGGAGARRVFLPERIWPSVQTHVGQFADVESESYQPGGLKPTLPNTTDR